MSSKRWFVDKRSDKGITTQCGGGSKTGDKAREKVRDYRDGRNPGDSHFFSVREGRKS